MNAALYALGGIAAALGATITLEAMPAAQDAPVPRRAAPVIAMHAAPVAEHMRSDDALAATILARPLFAPDRRPDAEPAAQGGPGVPRLSGIVFVPGGTFGIFQPDAPSKPVEAPMGGKVAGCSVGAIEHDRVTLTCGGITHVLHPSYAQGPSGDVVLVPVTRLLHAKRTDPALQP